jgi:hypothetical protein
MDDDEPTIYPSTSTPASSSYGGAIKELPSDASSIAQREALFKVAAITRGAANKSDLFRSADSRLELNLNCIAYFDSISHAISFLSFLLRVSVHLSLHLFVYLYFQLCVECSIAK